MAIRLDHTIVPARDRNSSARFLSEILGLSTPTTMGSFTVVRVGDTSFDFLDAEDEVRQQHYAFLVTEAEFDAIFSRIRSQGLRYWADPYRKEQDQVNTWDGGRGVYWDDPDGHLLEIITRPYGSGGTTTEAPHPLMAEEAGGDTG